jgi:hypothetical protein
MVAAPQGAMRHASQIWQVVFASQTLEVFCLALRKKAQYVVMHNGLLWLQLLAMDKGIGYCLLHMVIGYMLLILLIGCFRV